MIEMIERKPAIHVEHSEDCIHIKGAREHNLKDIDIYLPRNKFVVLTGISGSGKSSLAFDTLYAEGQRRYVESLSSYARQFLGQMEKPDVDYIEGLSPAISIDQKTTSRNPRSTVGTVTEVHDYLRLLYARIGVPHCPQCGKVINQQSIDQMVDQVLMLENARIMIMGPVVRGRKGEHVKMIDELRQEGYVRLRLDGVVMDINDDITMDKKKKHTLEVVVDRLVAREDSRQRLADSLETALTLGQGLATVAVVEDGETTQELIFSQNYACPDCGISIGDLEPRLFSFNSPFGACPDCSGLGTLLKVDPDLVVLDPTKSVLEGGLNASGWRISNADNDESHIVLRGLAKFLDFSLETPIGQLPEKAKNALLFGIKEKFTVTYDRDYGSGSFETAFEGVIPNLERRYMQTQSDGIKADIESVMAWSPCPSCGGQRFKREALAVTVGERSIAEVSRWSIAEARDFFQKLELSEKDTMIASQITKEINARLGFLVDVGLDYLTLARSAGSLSGGEAQRIRLATQIGSGLVGVLYILDEPSIGLHQRDNKRLLSTLRHLQKLGNTLIVVEHDEETMYAADYIVDIGPGAGRHGGHVIAEGTVDEIKANPNSITGLFLSGKRFIPLPAARRVSDGRMLTVAGCRENNLKDIDVAFPVGLMTCITGVSGSGKSTLINEILYKTLARDLNRAHTKPGKYSSIGGLEYLDKVIAIDQSPIGRTPRSNPATYTGVFDLIRDLFTRTPEARARGYKNSRFSFNVKGGRCEACHGDGILKIEMHFLPDVYVPCEVCKGKRYNRETMEVKYKGKSIADVLEMTVEEACTFFEPIPQIARKVKTLADVGLGYIQLGQPSTQLSGGEAQRVKLATELSRAETGRTAYILDEPTTGLHMADVERLVDILQRLTDTGNTVLVIEHNLDVIKTADFLIDMGPEGGDRGGMVVAQGTPEEVAQIEDSYTGQFLKKVL